MRHSFAGEVIMNRKSALAALALTVVTAGAAQASSLNVLLDHAERLPVAGAASVIVANPAVADVTVVDSRTLYVMGRAAGSTNIVVLDRTGRPVFSSDIAVIRSGQPVAVFHGIERTNFTCTQGCAKDEQPNGFLQLLAAAAARSSAASAPASGTAAPAAHP